MKHLLLYHLFPVNDWRHVSEELLSDLPYQGIVVHVSLPHNADQIQEEVTEFVRKYPVDAVWYSANSGNGEVDALRRLVTENIHGAYDTLTYLHSKGVTKPGNRHIQNWRRIMYYFVVQRRDLVERAFRKGYYAYGINKTKVTRLADGFHGSRFFYEGNFVVLNLRKVDLTEAVAKQLEDCYYAVEGFWGKLGHPSKAYTAFNSGVNHYVSSVPCKDYMTRWGRWRYTVISLYYRIKS